MSKSKFWLVVLSMTFMVGATRNLQAEEPTIGSPISVPGQARIKVVGTDWFIYPSGDTIGGDPIIETTSNYAKARVFYLVPVPQWVEMYRITDEKRDNFMCISGDSDGDDLYVEWISGRSSCMWQFVPSGTPGSGSFLLRMVGSSRFVWASGKNMGGGDDNYAVEAGKEDHSNKLFTFVTQ